RSCIHPPPDVTHHGGLDQEATPVASNGVDNYRVFLVLHHPARPEISNRNVLQLVRVPVLPILLWGSLSPQRDRLKGDKFCLHSSTVLPPKRLSLDCVCAWQRMRGSSMTVVDGATIREEVYARKVNVTIKEDWYTPGGK